MVSEFYKSVRHMPTVSDKDMSLIMSEHSAVFAHFVCLFGCPFRRVCDFICFYVFHVLIMRNTMMTMVIMNFNDDGSSDTVLLWPLD